MRDERPRDSERLAKELDEARARVARIEEELAKLGAGEASSGTWAPATGCRRLSDPGRILHGVPDAMWVLDSDLRICWTNEAGSRLAGTAGEQIVGRFCWEVLPAVHGGPGEGPAARARESRERVRALVQVGGRAYDVTADPVLDDAGQLLGIVETFREIAVPRTLEEELARKQEEAERYLELAEIVFVALDALGRVTMVNRKGCELLGRSREEILGRDWFEEFLPEGSRDEVRSVFYRLMAGELTPDAEFHENPVVDSSGRLRTIAWRNTILRDEDGSVVGTLSAGIDVTELKMLREHRDRLQGLLERARRMEALGRLAGGLAHDFNNLLTVINSYAELVLHRLPEGSDLREDVQAILDAGRSAAELTGQILAFGRRQVLKMEVLDVNEVLRGMEGLLRRLLGESIELSLFLAEDLRAIRADRAQLERIVINLAANARDAMPHGGTLLVETANVDLDASYAAEHPGATPGPHVLLAVTDTGVGMSVEVLERAFEPFFTTKERGRGTGLGLATVYGTVRQLGGCIWAYSEPGRGSTFKCYFPAVEGVTQSEEENSKVPSGAGEKVLVVEDEEAVRRVMVHLLREAGYEVLEAGGPEEALRICQERDQPVDLLLTDVIMPEMSGKDLADRLQEQWPELAVLFVSGYTDNVIVHHGVLEPGTRFLGKPFTIQALLRAVREALDED